MNDEPSGNELEGHEPRGNVPGGDVPGGNDPSGNLPSGVALSDQDSEELGAYLDGELDSAACARVDRRLAEDASYRQNLQSMQNAWDLLDRLPTPAVSEAFAQTTVEMVAVSAVAEMNHRAAHMSRRRKVFNSLCGAAALGAVVIGFAIASRYINRDDRALVNDLPVIENVEMYRHAESVEFLRQLQEAGLFEQEVDDAP